MKNEEILAIFEDYLRNGKNAPENTLASYLRDIRQLADFLEKEEGTTLYNATDENLNNYISKLRADGKSVATVSRAIASIKALYTNLCINQYLKKNPALKLVPDKQKQKLPEILTDEEIQQLLRQPKCIDAKGYRDHAMLQLLYATGIRVSELIDLNLEDYDSKTGLIRCDSRGRERFVPVGAAAPAVDKYLKVVRPQMVADEEEEALFVNISGQRMSRQGFWKIVKYYSRKAGIEKDITPHTLRHSFAARLIEGGTDLRSVKEILGHADLSSTTVYSNIINGNLKEVYDKTHPYAK